MYNFKIAKNCLEPYFEYNFITDELRKLRNADKKKINYYDIEYLTGGWFEEYIFYKMKEKFKVSDEFIGLNYSISITYGKNVKPLLENFTPRIKDAENFAINHRVLLINSHNNIPVDITLSGLPFEERMKK